MAGGVLFRLLAIVTTGFVFSTNLPLTVNFAGSTSKLPSRGTSKSSTLFCEVSSKCSESVKLPVKGFSSFNPNTPPIGSVQFSSIITLLKSTGFCFLTGSEDCLCAETKPFPRLGV